MTPLFKARNIFSVLHVRDLVKKILRFSTTTYVNKNGCRSSLYALPVIQTL